MKYIWWKLNFFDMNLAFYDKKLNIVTFTGNLSRENKAIGIHTCSHNYDHKKNLTHTKKTKPMS